MMDLLISSGTLVDGTGAAPVRVMTPAKWDVVIDGLERLESPCLDLDGNLCFSDIAGEGAVYRLGSDGALETIVRRKNVGGLVPHAEGGSWSTAPPSLPG